MSPGGILSAMQDVLYKCPLHLLGIPSDSSCLTCPESLPGSLAYVHFYNTIRWRQRGDTSVPRAVYELATFLFEWSKTMGGCCDQLYDAATWGLDVYFAFSFPVGRGFAKGQFISQGGLTKCLKPRFRNRKGPVAVTHTIGLYRCVRRM
jgi:hypothetical protein